MESKAALGKSVNNTPKTTAQATNFFNFLSYLLASVKHYNPCESRSDDLRKRLRNNLIFCHISIFRKPWNYLVYNFDFLLCAGTMSVSFN